MVAADPFSYFWGVVQNNQQFTQFVLLFFFLIGIARVGTLQMAKSLKWEDKAKSATKVLGFVLGASMAISLHFWLNARNINLIEELGPWAVLLAVVFILLFMAFVFKKSGRDVKPIPFVIAMAIILLYHLMQALFPWFTEGLPGVLEFLANLAYYTALVYATIAIFMFFIGGTGSAIGWARGRWGGGSPTPPGPTPPGPTPPTPPTPPPGPPHDFSGEITQIETLLAQYNTEYANYQTRGNDILRTNHNHLTSMGGSGPPSPPVSPAQWRLFLDSTQQLHDIATRINVAIHGITTHADYGRMSPANMARWTPIPPQWAGYVTRTDNYRTDFLARLNRGDPPR
jgi:hypothetical protein